MAINKGIPITSVLGRVESENMVIDHSRLPFLEKLAHSARTMSMISFCRVSAKINLKFIAYMSFLDMKWNDSKGTAKIATKRFMPEH